jgi:hypothetical protein
MDTEAPKRDTRAEKPKKRRPRWLIPLIVIASFFVLIEAGSIYLNFKLHGYSESTYRKKIAPKHAKRITTALNKYYVKYGYYPAYLFGGSKNEGELSFTGVEWPYDDPLIRAGLLKKYPHYPFGNYHKIVREDPRSILYIRNVLVTSKSPLFEYFIVQYESKIADPRLTSEKKQLEDTVAYLKKGSPFLVPGGSADNDKNGAGYEMMPLELRRISDELLSLPTLPSGNFGYVRGEEMVGLALGDKSAFLWLYADPYPHGAHLGLDVVNADTGEIKPDGIPDGIVLLYELREGKVVKTTRAEDM